MAIRGVLFDVGGVLVRTEDPAPRLRWAERFHLSPADLSGVVFENPVARQATVGDATENEVWAEVFRELNLPLAEASRFREDFFAGDRWDEELLALIAKLHVWVRTGVLSNAWPGTREKMSAWVSPAVFDVRIFSGEVHLRKPDPRIYRLAMEQLGTRPEETLFVDDFEDNIIAAGKLGMRAIHFRHSRQIKLELCAQFPELSGPLPQ